jgi:CheY-like chemotaxis protein
MPDGTAWTVIRELRAHYRSVKILAVVGAARPEMYREALRLGANAMLNKPMSIGDLRDAVARCLVSEETMLRIP